MQYKKLCIRIKESVSTISVSYTHLDVYKRQLQTIGYKLKAALQQEVVAIMP